MYGCKHDQCEQVEAGDSAKLTAQELESKAAMATYARALCAPCLKCRAVWLHLNRVHKAQRAGKAKDDELLCTVVLRAHARPEVVVVEKRHVCKAAQLMISTANGGWVHSCGVTRMSCLHRPWQASGHLVHTHRVCARNLLLACSCCVLDSTPVSVHEAFLPRAGSPLAVIMISRRFSGRLAG